MYDSLLGPGAAKLAGETQSDNIERASSRSPAAS